MISPLISYLKYGNTYCSIEVTSLEEEEYYFKTTAKSRNNEFVDLEFEEADSISKISRGISKNQHSILIINSEKVLTKEVVLETDNNGVVSKAFPSLKLEDFYYEILRTSSKCFVSICRKDYVDKIIANFKEQSLLIISFHLGNTSIDNIILYLPNDPIRLPNSEIITRQNQIYSLISKNNKEEKIILDDIKVSSKFLVSLSGLFNYLNDPLKNVSNSSEENKALNRNYAELNFFKKGMLTGVLILLSIMLTNLVFFTSYFKKVEVLKQEVVVSTNQQQNLLIKKESIIQKEKIVYNLLNSSSSKVSFFLNRIASLKPNTIQYTIIEYQPLNRTIRPEKKIEYVYSKIKVHGESSNKNEFSKWLDVLETLNWIQEVTIMNYGGDKRSMNSFEIDISLKDASNK